MPAFTRRIFLRNAGLSVMPVIAPVIPALAQTTKNKVSAELAMVNFFGDGEMFEPGEYINQLQQVNNRKAIERDFYGSGGAVAALEKKFEELTGKEKAVFMPSGTMANQLAISVLSGDNTKVFVQDTSHVYRDEADAAQSVFNKRLMPLAKGETYFTAVQLKQALESLGEEEVFKSGIGAVSIENPVRRTNGKMVPIEEIRKISEYCRSNAIKLHLDGARIYMASAWSGISIKEYASYFDTIYISLYKYLGASAGAILCGDKPVMDKMEHLIKIHGGTMFGNWANAAMALNKMEGMEARLQNSLKRANELFAALNKLAGFSVNPLPGGTNIVTLQLEKDINGNKLRDILNREYHIRIPRISSANSTLLTVNETILYREVIDLNNAFREALSIAKK